MTQPTTDYYKVLGVARDARREVIDGAYKALAKLLHPDLNPSADPDDLTRQMAEINVAHEVLSDPARRATYDLDLAIADRARASSGPAQASPPAGRRSNDRRPVAQQPGVRQPSAASDQPVGRTKPARVPRNPGLVRRFLVWALTDPDGQWRSLGLLMVACTGIGLMLGSVLSWFTAGTSLALLVAMAQLIVGRRWSGTPIRAFALLFLAVATAGVVFILPFLKPKPKAA